MINSKKILITDRLLISWIRCKRKAWLDKFESHKFRRWSAHRSLQLDHQHKSLLAFCTEDVGRGLNATQRGVSNVIGVRLKGNSQEGYPLEAHPLLIQKINGKSRLGSYEYRPVIARQGKNLTRANKLSIAMSALLLEQFQDSPVKEGVVISLIRNRLEIDNLLITNKLKSNLKDSFVKLKIDLEKGEMPPIISDRKKCMVCSWKEYCNKEALEKGEITEVSGIGSKRKELLNSIGILNIKQLALSNSKDLDFKLNSHKKNHGIISSLIINQAKAQVNLQPSRVTTKKVLPEIDKSNGILIYDIESDPDFQHDFLHGFICIRKSQNGKLSIESSKYINIVSLEKAKGIDTWVRLKYLLNLYKDWPILHYGETEFFSISKLAREQKENDDYIKELNVRFIDIHKRIKDNWILPVNNYSLKTVAKWLNFHWSQGNVDGAKALFWWKQYQSLSISSKGKELSLNRILTYNKDDCLATLVITNWLLNN